MKYWIIINVTEFTATYSHVLEQNRRHKLFGERKSILKKVFRDYYAGRCLVGSEKFIIEVYALGVDGSTDAELGKLIARVVKNAVDKRRLDAKFAIENNRRRCERRIFKNEKERMRLVKLGYTIPGR